MIAMGKPKIRFKGYEDDWEQRKLGEIATETYGGGTPKTSNEEFWKGDIPWIQSSDLIDECLFDVRPRKCISQEAVSKSATKLVPQNSIAIVTRVGVGKLAFMPFSYATSQDFLSISELKTAPEFTVYALYRMMQLVSNEVQGTSIKGITKDELLAKKIIFPSCNEQKKIGAYLHNLDHLITLHQRKCEETKSLKKYMLQKMFPENGNCVPKIRFSGFADDWEQRKLGSLCDVFTDGDWIEAKDQSDSGIRLVQTGNVGTTEYLDKKNNKKWISEETFERLHCEEIYEGDILISRLPEPAGRACIMPDLGVRMITAVDCTIVRTSKGYDSKYLVQYLSTPMYFKVVNSFLGGGTRQRISRGNLSGIDIPIPSTIDEQGKIGELFANFDHLITLHQHKCDELQKLKKFMLQNMFV